MPFTFNRKSTYFSSTHVRICEKDATPTIFRMFLHFVVQSQNKPFFAMLPYYKLKIFTKMGRWKSCHFYNMSSHFFQATFCIEELWYSYRVAFGNKCCLSANKCQASFSTFWLLWISHTVASFMVLAKLQKLAISSSFSYYNLGLLHALSCTNLT